MHNSTRLSSIHVVSGLIINKRLMKKKYVLKKEPVLPQPQPEKPPQLTLELIRRFVSEAKFDTLPKVQLPRRKLLPAGGLERASSTRPNKP